MVVALEGGARVELDVAEELHPDDGVDEEQHEHEQPDVRQGLKVVKVNGGHGGAFITDISEGRESRNLEIIFFVHLKRRGPWWCQPD